MTLQTPTALLALVVLASPAMAEPAAAPASPPAAPASPPTASTPPGATKAPPTAEAEPTPREKMALKLAGLVAFVANACPQMKPDYARFKSAIGRLGFTTEDLGKEGMKSAYLAYTAQYERDPKGNCEKARLQFGPKGATMPDIFAPK